MKLVFAILFSIGVSLAQDADVLTIPATLIDRGKFMTLVTILEKAELVDVFSGAENYTVFAPNDSAFEKINDGFVSCINETDKDALVAILNYHSINGMVKSDELRNGTRVKTLSGASVNVTITDSIIMINDAKVTNKDIMATNGVIHMINTVLIPPNNKAAAALIAKCTSAATSAYTVWGITIPLIGMLAAAVTIIA